MTDHLNPSQIMRIGMGFFASKTLLSAVELGLFTELSKQPMTAAQIARALALSSRAVPDFPDALVALGFLQRTGDGLEARYSNTPESAMFLDRNNPSYIGGILEMANARLYLRGLSARANGDRGQRHRPPARPSIVTHGASPFG